MPSMSQASPPPSGSVMSRGARSLNLSGTNFTKSGGVSMWPSPEMTWYLRAMVGTPCSSPSSSRVSKEQVTRLVAEPVGQAPEFRVGGGTVREARRASADHHGG